MNTAGELQVKHSELTGDRGHSTHPRPRVRGGGLVRIVVLAQYGPHQVAVDTFRGLELGFGLECTRSM